MRDRQSLLSSTKSLGLADRTSAIRDDTLGWLKRQPVDGFDAIVSSEMLPEMTSSGLSDIFAECHGCLRAGRVTLRTFLSPIARNKRQGLLVGPTRTLEGPSICPKNGSPRGPIWSRMNSRLRDFATPSRRLSGATWRQRARQRARFFRTSGSNSAFGWLTETSWLQEDSSSPTGLSLQERRSGHPRLGWIRTYVGSNPCVPTLPPAP